MIWSGVANNTKSALARVSIVDYYGNVILDKYVKPLEHVSDYRSWVSGHHLSNAANFYNIRNQVSNLLKGKIVIGHALTNDWKALGLMHPESMIRVTSKFEDALQDPRVNYDERYYSPLRMAGHWMLLNFL